MAFEDIEQCSNCYSKEIYLFAEQKDFCNMKHKKVWDCKLCHERTTRTEELILNNLKGGLKK